MSDSDYVTVNIAIEFPDLWKEYKKTVGNGIAGSSSFNDFLKHKQISGFAKFGGSLAEAHIRRDHLMWLKLKY